jgi:hypothetical protein
MALRLMDLAALVCLALAAPAWAADYLRPMERPDPASVTVPALQAADPDGVRDYDKHFVFWRPDTSYEVAFSDLDECRIYGLETKIVAVPPKYAPLGATEIRKPETPVVTQYGIAGAVIGGLFIDAAQKDTYRQSEKRCMALKGYGRFGVSKATWNEVMAGKGAEALARRAVIAAGSRPATQSVDQ